MTETRDAEYEIPPQPVPAADEEPASPWHVLAGLGCALLLIPLGTMPVAPFFWLLMVAVGAAPMTWAGLLVNWLVLSGLIYAYFVLVIGGQVVRERLTPPARLR